MNTIEKLVTLTESQKNELVNKFGSTDELYKIIFDLHNSEYKLYLAKPLDFSIQVNSIQHKLISIEQFLDEIGIDGHYIISDIAGDHGEIIVKGRINELDNYLKKFGTNYEEMRKWIKETYGI